LNKKGNVENYTLEDLKSCVYPDGQRILTLEEFFSIVDGQVDYILDLKVKGIEKKIIELVRVNNLEKRIIIQSQSKNIIKKLYKLAPDLDYALYRGYMGNLGKLGSILKLHNLLAYTFYSLNIKPYPIKYLSSDGPFLYHELTSLLKKKGIKIILGSIRTHKYIKNIKKWNVEIITCNHVEYIRSLLKSYEKKALTT
jgi:glycerophosphoryl diester phosphodiesterase